MAVCKQEEIRKSVAHKREAGLEEDDNSGRVSRRINPPNKAAGRRTELLEMVGGGRFVCAVTSSL
jgi:hypothetical protein